MPSSWMRRRVVLVRADVSEKSNPSIIRVKRTNHVGSLRVTRNGNKLICPSNDGCARFLRKIGSYKRHTAVTSDRMAFFVVTAAKTSNLTQFSSMGGYSSTHTTTRDAADQEDHATLYPSSFL
jgi:hypothetical protein